MQNSIYNHRITVYFLAHVPLKTNPANIREKLRDFVKRRSLDRPNPNSPNNPKRKTVSKNNFVTVSLSGEVQYETETRMSFVGASFE